MSQQQAYTILQNRADILFGNLHKEYQDELQGFIDHYTALDPSISAADIKITNFFADIALPTSCSSYAAWGNKTLDGKTLFGRNLDFADPNLSIHHSYAVITIKEQGKSFTQIGSLLMPFSNLTLFSKTLSLSALIANIGEPLSVTSGSYALGYAYRDAIEHSDTLAGAKKILNRYQYTWGSLTAVATPQRSAILEDAMGYDRDYRYYNSVLNSDIEPKFNSGYQQIAAVNTFMLPENPLYFYSRLSLLQLDNQTRWQEFYQRTNNNHPETEQNVMNLMDYHKADIAGSTTDIYNHETLLSVIYRFGSKYAWVAFNSDKVNPDQMKYQKVSLFTR